MIDLDKYEGHTPGPWAWDDKDYCGLDGPDRDAVLTYCDFEGMHLTYGESREANGRLIADAPLLLAEVVRLRRDLDDTIRESQQYRADRDAAMEALRVVQSAYAWSSEDLGAGLSDEAIHHCNEAYEYAENVLAKHGDAK